MLHPAFQRPLYTGYAFSLLPHTVFRLLTQQHAPSLPKEALGEGRPDVLVLFLIDGFGWHFFEKFAPQYPFLRRFEKEGRVAKLSAQFPSTTAAHITTLCTGLEVGQTGIYEWFQYEPHVDRIITPLLFSFGGDHESETLKRAGVAPEALFPFTTLYQKLKSHQIESIAFLHESICHSSYTQTLLHPAQVIGYRSFSEGLEKAAQICKQPHPHPIYLYIYFSDIDSAGHRHGALSKPFNDAVHNCWHSIEEHFWKPLVSCSKRIALIATADHGMVDIDPRTTLYLNREFPRLLEAIQVNRQNQLIAPAGSNRDFFLHIQEDKLQDTHRYLAEQLRGKAEVYLVSELIQQGFFGTPSPRLLERVGNLVILPHPGENVWWYEKDRYEQKAHGAHGGLTPQEMDSPFLYIEI